MEVETLTELAALQAKEGDVCVVTTLPARENRFTFFSGKVPGDSAHLVKGINGHWSRRRWMSI